MSATVLMEYLKRASPEFVAAELDELGLLDAADEVAAAKLARVAALRATGSQAHACQPLDDRVGDVRDDRSDRRDPALRRNQRAAAG